jgi:2-hydroxy-3-keto-5-methylthiopentenyl-1-phosphate phosphatase
MTTTSKSGDSTIFYNYGRTKIVDDVFMNNVTVDKSVYDRTSLINNADKLLNKVEKKVGLYTTLNPPKTWSEFFMGRTTPQYNFRVNDPIPELKYRFKTSENKSFIVNQTIAVNDQIRHIERQITRIKNTKHTPHFLNLLTDARKENSIQKAYSNDLSAIVKNTTAVVSGICKFMKTSTTQIVMTITVDMMKSGISGIFPGLPVGVVSIPFYFVTTLGDIYKDDGSEFNMKTLKDAVINSVTLGSMDVIVSSIAGGLLTMSPGAVFAAGFVMRGIWSNINPLDQKQLQKYDTGILEIMSDPNNKEFAQNFFVKRRFGIEHTPSVSRVFNLTKKVTKLAAKITAVFFKFILITGTCYLTYVTGKDVVTNLNFDHRRILMTISTQIMSASLGITDWFASILGKWFWENYDDVMLKIAGKKFGRQFILTYLDFQYDKIKNALGRQKFSMKYGSNDLWKSGVGDMMSALTLDCFLKRATDNLVSDVVKTNVKNFRDGDMWWENSKTEVIDVTNIVKTVKDQMSVTTNPKTKESMKEFIDMLTENGNKFEVHSTGTQKYIYTFLNHFSFGGSDRKTKADILMDNYSLIKNGATAKIIGKRKEVFFERNDSLKKELKKYESHSEHSTFERLEYINLRDQYEENLQAYNLFKKSKQGEQYDEIISLSRSLESIFVNTYVNSRLFESKDLHLTEIEMMARLKLGKLQEDNPLNLESMDREDFSRLDDSMRVFDVGLQTIKYPYRKASNLLGFVNGEFKKWTDHAAVQTIDMALTMSGIPYAVDKYFNAQKQIYNRQYLRHREFVENMQKFNTPEAKAAIKRSEAQISEYAIQYSMDLKEVSNEFVRTLEGKMGSVSEVSVNGNFDQTNVQAKSDTANKLITRIQTMTDTMITTATDLSLMTDVVTDFGGDDKSGSMKGTMENPIDEAMRDSAYETTSADILNFGRLSDYFNLFVLPPQVKEIVTEYQQEIKEIVNRGKISNIGDVPDNYYLMTLIPKYKERLDTLELPENVEDILNQDRSENLVYTLEEREEMERYFKQMFYDIKSSGNGKWSDGRLLHAISPKGTVVKMSQIQRDAINDYMRGSETVVPYLEEYEDAKERTNNIWKKVHGDDGEELLDTFRRDYAKMYEGGFAGKVSSVLRNFQSFLDPFLIKVNSFNILGSEDLPEVNEKFGEKFNKAFNEELAAKKKYKEEVSKTSYPLIGTFLHFFSNEVLGSLTGFYLGRTILQPSEKTIFEALCFEYSDLLEELLKRGTIVLTDYQNSVLDIAVTTKKLHV